MLCRDKSIAECNVLDIMHITILRVIWEGREGTGGRGQEPRCFYCLYPSRVWFWL